MNFVGREKELSRMNELICGTGAAGVTVLVSGEAGLGKTVLLAEVRKHARKMEMKVLEGACYPEQAEPFLPFSKALDAVLFDEQEHVSFRQVLVINDSGLLMASASQPGGSELDTDIFAGMLTAVQNFVGDSFSDQQGSLGRLEYGDLKIITERMSSSVIVAIFEGNEHPDMARTLKSAAANIEAGYGEAIRAWKGDAASAVPVLEKAEAVANARFLVRKNLEGVKLETERLRISEIILENLKSASATKPLLLVLEDMHWADESSLFAFEYLVRNIGRERIALIASYRPEDSGRLSETLKKITPETNVTEIELSQMDAGTVRALADSMYSPNDFTQDFIDRMARDCQGNPFFLTELFSHMSGEGIITATDGTYRVKEALVSIPSTIRELVQRRLDSMDPEEMALAEYISCIGKRFDLKAANSLTSVRDSGTALDSLLGKGIILLTDKESGRMEFSHSLFRDVIYSEISPRWISAHHRTLGEYYETEFSDSISDVVYELARHFSRTNEKQKAFEYCMMAGEKAESGFAAEQALAFYDDALKASISEPEKQAVLHERMGDLCFILSDCNRAVEHYTAAMDIFREPEQRAEMLRKIADSCEKLSEYDRAKAEAARGLGLLSGRESPVEARLLMSLGRVKMRQGDYPGAIDDLSNAARSAEKHGCKKDQGMTEHLLGSVFLHKGEFPEARKHFEVAVSIREEIGDISGIAASNNNIGNVLARTGEWEKALEYYISSSETDAKLGDRLGHASTLTNIASVHLSMGKPDDAIPILEESIAIEKKIGDKRGLAISLINLNLAHYLKGEYEKSIGILTEALDICEKNSLKYECIFCYNGLCELYSLVGRTAEGLGLAQKSLALSREMGTREGEAMSLLNEGCALLNLEQMDDALTSLETALSLMEEISHNQIFDACFALGTYWVKAGDPNKARQYLERAMAGYEKNGNSANAERCRKDIASLAGGE